jgi:hypothetical protein
MSNIVPRLKQLKTPTGVVYDDTASFKLDAGVYHVFEIQTNLAKKATIKKITVDIDGTPVTISTGEQLEVMEKLLQKHEASGRIVLDLSKFEYRSPRGIYKTALAIGANEDATLNIEFGVKHSTDPEIISMKGKAFVSDNPAARSPLGGRLFVPVRKTLTQDSAAAGTHPFRYPGGNSQTFVQRMLLDESAVNISKVTVFRGDTKISELERADIDFMLARYAGIAPQSGFLLLDFTAFGFGENDAISTDGLNFEFETDGVGAIKTYVEGWTVAQ